MTFHYTARAVFDKSYNETVYLGKSILSGSELIHLTELVSLDNILNESLDRNDETY